jgi:uncharacterized protein YbjT (DUF2867 family)
MTTNITKVALAGASGSLGRPVLEHLIAANFRVTVLTREDSTSSFPAGIKVAKVDYNSEESLTAALQGQDALVSTIATESIMSQEKLIKAAIAARVSRIIPSEFGSDTLLDANKQLPVYGQKIAIQKLLGDSVKDTNGQVTYTLVLNAMFLDWAIDYAFMLDAKNKKIVLYDGGETPYSATPLHAVAKGVVGVLKHPQETANRAVRIHGKVLTQKRVLELGKKALGEDGWTVVESSTADSMQQGWEIFKKDPANVLGWVYKFLESAIFSSKHTPEFAEVDNELLGVPDVDDEEIIEYIKKAASA